jgi:hypothetical protein
LRLWFMAGFSLCVNVSWCLLHRVTASWDVLDIQRAEFQAHSMS